MYQALALQVVSRRRDLDVLVELGGVLELVEGIHGSAALLTTRVHGSPKRCTCEPGTRAPSKVKEE
jgi:hypothetical protein